MRKILLSLVVGLFLLVPMAFALTMDDVGQVDTIDAFSNNINGDANEIRFLLGLDDGADVSGYTLYKYEGLGAGFQLVDGTAMTYYFDFYYFFDGYSPEKFMIKTGANVTYEGGTYDAFRYLNEDFLRYAVIDLSEFGRSAGNVEIAMVSHVSAGPAQVPEPSTLLLLGTGIAGLALYRRRKS